ncbi:dephospho-CoA kinase [Spirochaetia bacterium]|nr:dephospho-CoA kinase [Spirochaetia bacterium]
MTNPSNQQKIFGLTGTYCAGKNHIGRLLEERGLPVLDVDTLGHSAIEMRRDAILERFGGDILGADGAIDRRLLGAKVFGKPAELAELEGIVHPAVNEMTLHWIAAREGKPCVINAALLHRSSAMSLLSCIILVRAPVLLRLLRAKKRDGLPLTQLLRRFWSQRQFIPQYSAKNADIYVIENPGYFGLGPSVLENRISEILSRVGMA